MTIGERLKEERERIRLTQAALGAVGGVLKQSQLKYESGASFPNAQYLAEIAKVGVDVQYVILGVRAEAAINDDEKMLLNLYRAAAPEVRLFMLQGKQSSHESGNNQIAVGNQNIQIKGN